MVVIPYSITSIQSTIKSLCTSSFLTNTGGITVGRYFPAHPNYGINGGSINSSIFRNFVAIGTNGPTLRFLVRRFTNTFTVTNNEAFPVHVSLTGIASIAATANFLASNSGTVLLNHPASKYIYLEKVGVAGCTKKISMSSSVCALEGISSTAQEQSSYWNTVTTISTLYPIHYFQVTPVDGVTIFTAATGVSFTVDQTYVIETLQQSQQMAS